MAFVNIFDTDFRLPSKVCILAPGPNGKTHYADIPDDYTVLAVNKAVLIDAVEADVWLMNLADQAWFEAANAVFEGVRVFWREEPDSPHYNPVIEQRLQATDHTPCYYFHAVRPGLRRLRTGHSIAQLIGLHILSGGTVTGAALQLACHFGAREVLLCGVDLSGDDYWDGSVGEQPGNGETWRSIDVLNALIRWMTLAQGIAVATLSPTKLDVPPYHAVKVFAEQTR